MRHRALSIDLDDAERVESGRDGLPRMDGAKRLREPPEPSGDPIVSTGMRVPSMNRVTR